MIFVNFSLDLFENSKTGWNCLIFNQKILYVAYHSFSTELFFGGGALSEIFNIASARGDLIFTHSSL